MPLLTHLPSLCIHSVSLGQSGFLAPARLLPGFFLAAAQLLRRAAGAYNGDHTMTDRVLLALGLALLALTITAVILYVTGMVPV
jgi:hypothetical protein